MKFQKANNSYLLRLEKGDEVFATLKQFCQDQNLKAATLSGIGAATDLDLGYFNVHTNEYKVKNYPGDYEITAMNGNISRLEDGSPAIHIHITIGDENFQAHAGHLMKATISVTCEILIQPLDLELTRSVESEFGLKFLDL